MIKQECIGIPDMILLLMIFCFKKIKIKAEIVLSPGGAYFDEVVSLQGDSLSWSVGVGRTCVLQRTLWLLVRGSATLLWPDLEPHSRSGHGLQNCDWHIHGVQ